VLAGDRVLVESMRLEKIRLRGMEVRDVGFDVGDDLERMEVRVSIVGTFL
jgi:hypothetical protein